MHDLIGCPASVGRVKLEKKLEAWRAAGLLTEAQAAAIRAHEQAHQGHAGRWVASGLGAVGGLAIVIGIISIISANWSEIPAALKIGALLATMIGALVLALRFAAQGRTLVRDLLLLGHDGLVLAMIGLVAQTFHLHGAPWRGLALAAVFAVVAAAQSEGALLSHVAIGYVLGSFWMFLDHADLLRRYFASEQGFIVLPGSVGLVLLLAGGRLRGHAGAAAALPKWGAALVSVAVFAAAWRWSEPHSGRAALPTLFALLAALTALYLVELALSRRRARIVAGALVAAFVLGGAIVSRSLGEGTLRVTGFVLFCAMCGALAMAAAEAGSRRLTNLFTLLIAARILVLYLELVRNLMTTGFGLILTGLVFCAVAYGWWRLRAVVAPAPEPR